ncbi:putative ribonuclease H-like domain-containing protein [Tanacetum coccineum]
MPIEMDLTLEQTQQGVSYEVSVNPHRFEGIFKDADEDRRNEMKARQTMLMALPNKDQLKFHSYKDAKLLMETIEKRYGGNKESKKLKIQGEVITQEDMNLKLLRSLPSEWKTYALIWRNKEEIETISLDDLYNNLKIYEPEITGSSSISQNLQNVAFMSSNSNSSTNEADNTAYGVSATHTQSNLTSGDNLSDAVICAFLSTMRFIKRTGRKLDVNGQRVGFDRSKVECYNCHKNGHFARECRAPRNQENKRREINRRTMIVETPTENALVAQDRIGGSDSEVDSCSKSCVKAYATLKEQYDSLSSDYKNSQFNLVSYKAGLESVEARLAHYKKNEVVYEESINVLNLEVKLKDNALVENKKKLEKAEKERDELKLTLEKFKNSSKSLNNLLESQVSVKFKIVLGYNVVSSTAASPVVESFMNSSEMLENQENNKSKSDKGYHAVPPPYTWNFIPFKPDLTFMDEIVESEKMDVTTIVTPSNVKTVESNHESADVKSNGDAVEPKTVRKNSFRPPVIEDWDSDDDSEVEFIPNVKDKTIIPRTKKIKFVKSARETVEKVETHKQDKHYPRGNQRNWNNLMSQKLGSNFKMINKACFVCGSFEHLHYVCDKKVIRPVWNNSSRVNHKNFANKMTHPYTNRRFVPQAVLTKSGKINIAGASVNTAVRPVNIVGSKTNVNTVRVKDTTARDRAVVSENKGKRANAVKASACWVWKAKNSSASNTFKKYSYIDARGRSKHMTGNKCYLTKYEDYDGGFVSFGDGKGRISGKRVLRGNSVLLGLLSRMDKAVNTAFYVINKVLVIKPHNKTPYELIRGRTPLIDFMKPFRCPVTILNTRDHLGKFDGKADEGFFVGYSVVSKAMRVFNLRTMIVKETLNIRFLENIPNVIGNGPDWLFDVDSLTIYMNYVPVVAGNQTNNIAGTRDNFVADPKVSKEDAKENPTKMDESGALDKDREDDQATRSQFERLLQQEKQIVHHNSTNSINTVSIPVSAARPSFTNDDPSSLVNAAEASNAFEEHLFERFSPFKNAFTLPPVSNVTPIDDTRIFGNAYDDEDAGAEADLNNLETTMNVSPIPTTRIDKDHPKDQIIGDLNSAIQTWRMTKIFDEHAMRATDIKWVFRNKKDKRGIVVRNKSKLAVQGYTQEKGIDYDEVFAPVARIEAIRLFLAYASFMGFIVYPMDVKSAFLYEKALYGLHQAPKAWYETLSTYLIEHGFRRGTIDKTLFIKKDKASTPMEPNKALVRDEEADSVNVHFYRLMIRSLMYLTASRPDITFAVCTCASVYAGASLDRKSTTRGCQFLSKRLISWQCKKQIIVANSTTEAEYDAATNFCGKVLWIQNQMLDYGFNFMNTKIYIDNESTICIVKNPAFHSKTKHIEIKHHFIKDSYEKRFNFLVASIGKELKGYLINNGYADLV